MALSEQQFKELKEELKEQNRDLYLQSHQAKDKELSGLHDEILRKLTSHEVWRDELNVKLDNIEKTQKVVSDFMIRAEPVIKMAENLSWLGKTFLVICVALATIAGGIMGYKEIINNVTHK